MNRILNFEDWAITEGFGTKTGGEPALVKAADLIGALVNRKTGGGWVRFPMVSYFNGVPGVTFFHAKSDSSFRVMGKGMGQGPGIVGSLDMMDRFWHDEILFSLSSETMPIMKLLDEWVRLISDEAYLKQVETQGVMESRGQGLTSGQLKMVEAELAKGASVLSISKSLGVSYNLVAKVKKGGSVGVEVLPEVAANEATLEDRVKFMEETMQDVYDISRAVAAGGFNSLFISGRAGTGKTYSVEKAMHDEGLEEGEDWIKISGAVSTVIMYKQLYSYRDKVLVFDDCDAVFSNEDGRNILKAALDTKRIRKISYMKKVGFLYDPRDYANDPEGELNALENGMVPNQFDFAGRVIFISNLDKSKADPDGAIRSRSILVDVNPDDATLMERMRLLLPHLEPRDMPLKDKEEIYEFMKQAKDVSMRTFVKAAGFKMAGLSNWQRMAKRYL